LDVIISLETLAIHLTGFERPRHNVFIYLFFMDTIIYLSLFILS